jgi:ACT domain-containing protein
MTSDHDNTITGGEIEFFKLVLNPSAKVVREISLVKRLLKEGKALYKAIREAGLGQKNYYKYAPLVYDDPEILVPLPKTTLKE